MNELLRIQFAKTCIGAAVGIYVILDFFVFAQICTERSRKCFMRPSGTDLSEQKIPVLVLILYKLHYIYSIFVDLFFVLQTALQNL